MSRAPRPPSRYHNPIAGLGHGRGGPTDIPRPPIGGGRGPRYHHGGPPPPPPPKGHPGRGRGGGRGSGGGGATGGGGRSHLPFNPRDVLANQLAAVRSAMMAKGVDGDTALRYARILLSRPNVQIGAKGIRWNGQRYSAESLAGSKLADYITGEAAKQRNQKALEGDPGYQQALADATYQQSLATAGLDDQMRRSVIDYGDPRYALTDSTLAGQAQANPFSILVGLQRQAHADSQAVQAATNRAGTLFGGGKIAGDQGAQRANAGRVSEATRSLEDVLAGLNRQHADATAAFDYSKQRAILDAQTRLTQSGVIHPSMPPSLTPGRFRIHDPNHPNHPVGILGGGSL